MELREKCHEVGMRKEAGTVALAVVKCMARVRETRRLLPQSQQQTRVVHARKWKKQTKDKNCCEAARKVGGEGGLTTLEECFGIFFFVIKHPSLLLLRR